MQVVRYPNKNAWKALAKRPIAKQKDINKRVKPIIKTVKKGGDKALVALTKKFDGVKLKKLHVTKTEIEEASAKISKELKESIRIAADNIRKFHESQIEHKKVIETTKGVNCWRKAVAIEKVGLYIPGGSAPLFSTVLMLAIPAQIAGCQKVVLCTPPNKNGAIHPAILFACQLCGIEQIFKVGGAQAIAAMAYGTKSITKVDKIFGPGNQYVTAAKQIVNRKGTAIDMPAGPSEAAVIADETANADFIAADLIAQAEHGKDSQVVLLTTSEDMIKEVQKALANQLADLPRAVIAKEALKNSVSILSKNIDEALEFSNFYAPEHLIISCKNYNEIGEKVINAGSVFLGHYTPESLGDYASGTNHTLPTNGFASTYSGVSIDSFVKKITFQEASKDGLAILGRYVEIMASEEELIGHKRAVTYRLEALNDKKNS